MKLSNLIEHKIKAIGFLFIILYTLPIVFIPLIFKGYGIYDWDTSLQRYAAIYLTYTKFHQFPGNNIWIGGGIPLMQIYPGYGIFALSTIVFGPDVGLHLGLFLYFILGFVGAIKLAKIYTRQTIIQLFFALYTVLGNALAWHLSVGHIIFANILLIPLILYYTLTYHEKYAGAKAGFLSGAAFLDGFAYTNQYLLLIVAIIILYFFIAKKEQRSDVLMFTMLFFLVFLSVGFYRIYTILPILNDYPRIINNGTSYGVLDFLKFSFVPFIKLRSGVTSSYCNGVWENANYVGLIPLCLLIYATIKRSIYFMLPILFLWCAYSNDVGLFQFNYYLKLLPTFSSHWCTARLRLLSPYVVGLALLAYFIKYDENRIKIFGNYLTKTWIIGLILVEVYAASTFAFLQSHKYDRIPSYSWRSDFQNYKNVPAETSSTYELTMSNIGVLSASDSNLSSSLLGQENNSTVFEYVQNEKSVQPILWSPNLIIFQTNDLQNCVQTKIPAGNLWLINNQDVYSEEKAVEFRNKICAYPDKNGRVELKWSVRHSEIALLINFAIIVCAICVVFLSKKYYNV